MRTVVRQGLVAPAIVAAITLVAWPVAGPEWALATLAAGAASIIAWHLYNAQRVLDWASGALDGRVPESRREWGDVFSAIYRRTRLRDTGRNPAGEAAFREREVLEDFSGRPSLRCRAFGPPVRWNGVGGAFQQAACVIESVEDRGKMRMHRPRS